MFIPPLKFSTVQEGFYRGAYPREINFPFLESLSLKTIVSLTPSPVTPETDPKLYDFATRNKITLVHLECEQSGKGKKRGVPLGYSTVLEALDLIIHTSHSPIYVHCVNGGQVTSLIVACLRKLQFWTSLTIFNEFINYTTNITLNDRNFVEGFRGDIQVDSSDKVSWLWNGMSNGVVSNHPMIKIHQSDI
ncbi:protein-tyrosine phosphatase [Yamadazyma tenuis ATCC 10573]|uniref:Protein-tyrosine phosphatase n=1 Tax=Candida tenuis (strain ATCC 10573 / BCRC 21748 / CBS 615 / JCM 9827 / NBRC 10315 / NRRL Y-1498 / VKM Y-70) TaxID=590646 RepID=G3BE65_CANTC|nr:protein-tyrosine phosphatase [Yamadazyma tenuis ATCC 10573]EGV60470.1 protein-tyrosine phosphatase [Yamadazyma tenuis ATCC 10573]